ncbi:HD domain-containing phosphohydrolase [Roseibium aggregatum]|uniref:Response regulator n=1 Tax=Roseibium aggregatum TaxID=187304 RepID=A0A926NY34_9HYPH|nr:HD domain-containing phosphohydrolase [Roseibium aggregatum]MBD1546210.1 response regulator [Roseibium aggregatum]
MERKRPDQILVVDTDTKVLEAFVRLFQDKAQVITFAETESALKWLKENGGVSVIVTALNVPGRGGSAFLHASEAFAPHASRIILTTETSVDRLKEAVNERHIFMFLNKPCSATELTAAVDGALAHYAQLTYERQMLEKTLSGSVKLLIEMLALFHTEAFRRTPIMRAQALKIAKKLSIKRTWELEMAVMFSPLGEALLPREILGRYRAAKTLTDQERRVLATAPAQTKHLLQNIPQLERVADVLYLSGRGFDGSGFPEDGPTAKDIPLNSRIIKLLTDLWYASPETGVDAAAFEALTINKKQYDPHLLEIAKACLLDEVEAPQKRKITACYIRALKPGDILIDDALTEGTHELVLSSGHELTETTIRRLEQFDKVSGVRQPIRVHRAVKLEEEPKAVNA